MRVIAGSSRGRRLPARLPGTVRPTADRVREAIFDMLGSMGGVDGLTVLDLFCGSGALGLEALSRGAASVAFVDHDAAALAAVETNLKATGLEDARAALVRAVLPAWLGRAAHVDLALCDPPYTFGDWRTLLESLDADVVVLESSSPVVPPEGWVVARERRYGGTLVTVARAGTSPS
ncbi:MAG: RsmD family RNA methyltransferase [Acidimicrobiales bacterium]